MGEYFHAEQPDTDNLGVEQGGLEKKGLLDRFTGILSFSGAQDTYRPGGEISVEITADTEQSYDTADAVKVVEIYKCGDSSCETPPPISSGSEDQCSEEEWYPQGYDDCIAKDTDTVSFSVTQGTGTSWIWDVSFSGLQDEAQYILVGYIRTPSQGIVTDVSKEKFRVEEPTTDSDGDGVIDSNDNCPNTAGEGSDGCPVEPQIVENGVTVDKTDSQVTATVELENTGNGDMQQSNIIEMQVRPEGAGVLSFISDTEQVCDEDFPENVHKGFRLDRGDSRIVELSASTEHLEPGQNYDVYILTANDCYPDNEPVQPFYGGEKVGSFNLEEEATAKIEQASVGQTVRQTGSKVIGEVSLTNTGGADMSEADIIEMQVRPKGSGLLSALTWTSPQKTCDPSHPENVHKEFQIASGESQNIQLEVDKSHLEAGQRYDVWLVTRQGCGEGPAEPYGTGVIADTIVVEDGNSGGLPVLPVILLSSGLVIIGYGVVRWR